MKSKIYSSYQMYSDVDSFLSESGEKNSANEAPAANKAATESYSTFDLTLEESVGKTEEDGPKKKRESLSKVAQFMASEAFSEEESQADSNAWNDKFQELLDMEDCYEKFNKMRKLALDFVYCASSYGR